MSEALNLNSTIGAAFLGVIAASILFGITNLQTYIYYRRYPRDWIVYKIFVGVLWALDTLHLSLTVHLVYHYLITNFGNFIGLTVIIWSFKLQIAINVVIICTVQSLYALRVWKLGSHKNKVVPIFVCFVVIIGYAVAIIIAVETYKTDTFVQLEDVSWAIDTSFSTSTIIDIVITSSLLYYLRSSRSGFTVTNSKIATLINYTLSSGLATSACSMAALITYLTMPTNLVFIGIEFLLTKLYINSFVAMLNARQGISERNDDGLTVSITNLRSGSHQVSSQSAAETDKNGISLSPISPRSLPSTTTVVGGPADSSETFPHREGKSVYRWDVV